MQIKSYNQMRVQLIQSTPKPQDVVGLALRMTMHFNIDNHNPKPLTASAGKYLLSADHTSPLEHVVYTFLISEVSRSFLAQITRHRMSSFTSASQHYQNYQDYPCIVLDAKDKKMEEALLHSYIDYHELRKQGKPVWEARQVLPNAAAVNILWTINARSLLNFLRQRLCMRNVSEMQVFANRIINLVSSHFPEVFNHVGPQCYEGSCKQGKLACTVGPWRKWSVQK